MGAQAERPLYETDADLRNEADVANLLALRAGLRAYKLPRKFPLDYAFIDRREYVRQWLEVKCRDNRVGRYPSYMIAVSKLTAMMDLQRATGIQATLAVKWTDFIGLAALPVTFEVRIGGRVDRGDPQDIEPMAHIALGSFEIFSA